MRQAPAHAERESRSTILLVVMTICFLLATVTLCGLFRLQASRWRMPRAGEPSRCWCAARLPHPDDDRLASLRHRRSGQNWPDDARQRHRPPPGRAVDAAPAIATSCCSTDRHHHPWQSQAASLQPCFPPPSRSPIWRKPLGWQSLGDETPEGKSIVVTHEARVRNDPAAARSPQVHTPSPLLPRPG